MKVGGGTELRTIDLEDNTTESGSKLSRLLRKKFANIRETRDSASDDEYILVRDHLRPSNDTDSIGRKNGGNLEIHALFDSERSNKAVGEWGGCRSGFVLCVVWRQANERRNSGES